MLIRQAILSSINRSQALFPGAVLSRRFLASEHTSSSDSSDDEKPGDEKQTEKLKRLNDLLVTMKTSESVVPIEITPKKLKEKRLKMKADNDKLNKQKDNVNIQKVAQSVAKVLGGNIQKTESELLMKLLDIKSGTQSQAAAGEDGNLNSILTGMKVDKGDRVEKLTKNRSQEVKGILQGQQQSTWNDYSNSSDRRSSDRRQNRGERRLRTPDSFSSVDLFAGDPLNIFDVAALPPITDQKDSLSLWSQLQERELKMAVTQPPKNHFEKMIQWTDQGKLWRFPIDNEQGWEAEAQVSFADHVFLETHLEEWCPTSGPIRHFMELVCVGLSKNHYWTVQEKQAHIAWFRDYFEDKKEMLKEIIIQADESTKLGAGKEEKPETTPRVE